MPVIRKSMVLGGAFLAGIAIPADAGPLCRAGAASYQSPGRELAALPPANSGFASAGITLPQVNVFGPAPGGEYVKVPYVNAFGVKTTVEHYQVPPGYDTDPAMHPYTTRRFGPRASSNGKIRYEHYEVPPGFDANIAMHPYSSRFGPCVDAKGHMGCEAVRPSHYNR
jgi:hypothetical protein